MCNVNIGNRSFTKLSFFSYFYLRVCTCDMKENSKTGNTQTQHVCLQLNYKAELAFFTNTYSKQLNGLQFLSNFLL